MPQYDATNAEARVFTFKDGLLSKVAHDLEVKVTGFKLEVDPSKASVKADFDPRSLKVLGAVQDGALDPKALSDADKEKIEAQIRKEVLEADRHGRITFTSERVARRPDGGYDVSGVLELHGTKRNINVQTRVEGARQVAEFELNQPDYGIVPFKAMLGTLKVKPEVRVRISVPNT